MHHGVRALDDIAAVGVELTVLCAEIVVDRCAAEDALLHAMAFAHLVVPHLQDDAEAFHKEDTAKDGQQQFLVDDDGTHGDDAADGERAGITHEDLGGIGVVPEETDEGSHKGAHEHHQFLRVGNIHDVQVRGKLYMRTHIGEYAQRHANDGRVAGTHAVHAVVEVGTVAHCRHHEDGHDDEEYPSCRRLVLAAERHEVRVVQVVALDKRYGRLERLLGFGAVFHHHLLTLALYREVLIHLHVGRRP